LIHSLIHLRMSASSSVTLWADSEACVYVRRGYWSLLTDSARLPR